MLNTEVLTKLRGFHVPGFIQALVEQDERPQAYQGLSFDERLTLLIESEHVRRAAARTTRRLKTAGLLSHATIDQVDFIKARGITKPIFLEYVQGGWVKAAHHLIITGPTGVGKTFIGSAIANSICQRSFDVRYQRAHEWFAELSFARAQGTLPKLRARLARTHLIIIDEWLREPLASPHARDLLDIIDDRYRKTSCMFISQLPVPDWHAQIQDPTLADAILDRLVHDALRVELKGESMRKLTSPLKNGRGSSLRSAALD
jgi:DNA replication protein DnaC